MKIGIYKLYFKDNPTKVYIGASTQLEKRILNHKSALKRGDHPNTLLQEEVNKGKILEYEILVECSEDELSYVEESYIEKYNAYYDGFNRTIGRTGASSGELNPQANHSTEEYYQVLKLLADTDKSLTEISRLTKVSLSIIDNISSCVSHKYLEVLYPEDYKKLRSKLGTRDNSAKSKGIIYPDILSPSGQIYTINNISQFAKEHGLDRSNLHSVLSKKRKSHLGWRLK